MEHNLNPSLLTEQEFEVIEKLQNNPDPTSRLRSDYYSLRQREILSNYQDDIAKCTYYGDRVGIQQKLFNEMQELRKEYDADLNHAISLHLSTLNVWVPWGKPNEVA